MKINFIIILAVFFSAAFFSCSSNNTANNSAAQIDTTTFPEIDFDTAVFNFGKVLQGEQVSFTFKFKNTGKADLLIQKVETSCGCTVPEYDKKPVVPGGEGYIKVRFDSSGKEGSQYKTVKVISNCVDNIFDLVITGEVLCNN
ncbi:MAG: DUF1573 domain-containing protein [Bacteroidales bacterium]|nr:DUF1573 domain-containing protein [Bacteroidales bacterium]